MTDPNATEKAEVMVEEREHIRAIADEWCQVCGEDWPCRGSIDDEIRAAVEVETERCAKKNPAAVPCPKNNCPADIGEPCEDERSGLFVPCHPERWQAAIRARSGDEGEKNGDWIHEGVERAEDDSMTSKGEKKT